MAFLPPQFRGEKPAAKVVIPSWLSRKITPCLEKLAKISSAKPIYTVAAVAALASISYIGLLEDINFQPGRFGGQIGWTDLSKDSHTISVGEDTAWTWQKLSYGADEGSLDDHLALFTLDMDETHSSGIDVEMLAQELPLRSDANVLFRHDKTNQTWDGLDTALIFSVPYSKASIVLADIQKVAERTHSFESRMDESSGQKVWVTRAAKGQDRTRLVMLTKNALSDFWSLIRHAQSLDVAIMVFGYVAMHVTLVSLFQSMRRMGSQFWLAANVLFSSFFAFLFGLFVSNLCGVRVSLLVVAEGMPFLIVIVGFEKNIVITRSVLSHALGSMRPKPDERQTTKASRHLSGGDSFTQAAIRSAVRENGYEVAKAYLIEIAVLTIGASSGVRGSFQEFSFLAAWVLFFDFVLLYSFYVAVLCIKLEVTRIRWHDELRKTLEEDGVDERVAKDVAQSSDWPKADGEGLPGRTIFGREIKSKHVHNYKVIMVSGFLLINAYNLYTVQVRGSKSIFDFSSWTSTQSVTPGSVADTLGGATCTALKAIRSEAKLNSRETVVTILPSICIEAVFDHGEALQKGGAATSPLGDVVGDHISSQVVGGLLKSLEDPILSKWVIAALALSIALNGYLFNAATAGIQEPARMPIDRTELGHAQDFNAPDSTPDSASRQNQDVSESPRTPPLSDDGTETKNSNNLTERNVSAEASVKRSQEHMEKLLADDRAKDLDDEEAIELSLQGKIPGYALEKRLGDFTRAVKVRRATIARNRATSNLTQSLESSKLPYRDYNWSKVFGACCENVVGYMPLPVGVAGPLVIDGQSYFIPMATTEGVLVASTSRGCKAINSGGGAVTVLTDDGMTRGPCISFENLERAGSAKLWLDSEDGQKTIKSAFNSTSRFARLESLKTVIAGTKLYIRFKTTTGDAMGMNMISKGVEHGLSVMMDEGFEDMRVVSVSGNYCADKKAAALNWIEGRGKSVVAEAIIPEDAIKSILKTDVDSLVELNISKNLVGSAMAGAAGGFNAHAANIVAAIFIATGQDPAQVVESANCITTMSK